MEKAIFLDRDGTLMVDVGYCSQPEKVVLLPGVKEGLSKLKRHGFKLVIVTNQSGIARGYFSETDFWAVQRAFEEQLDAGTIDATYFCPEYPESPRRKPAPGMLLEAAQDLDIDLSRSVMVGDKLSDVEAGKNAGVPCNILLSAKTEAGPAESPDYIIAASMQEIVESLSP